jgi:hypothetical protein
MKVNFSNPTRSDMKRDTTCETCQNPNSLRDLSNHSQNHSLHHVQCKKIKSLTIFKNHRYQVSNYSLYLD